MEDLLYLGEYMLDCESFEDQRPFAKELCECVRHLFACLRRRAQGFKIARRHVAVFRG